MLHHRGTLIWATIFAIISAAGLGVGLMSLGPMMGLVIGDNGKALPELARDYNNSTPLFEIPEWLIAQLPTDQYHGVLLLVVFMAFLTIFGALAAFLHQYLSMMVVTKTIAGVRRDVFRRVIHMPLGRVVTRGPSDFISRIFRDASELQGGLIALTSKSIAQVTKGLAAFIVAFWFSWELSLIALVVTPVLSFALRKIGKKIRRSARGSLAAQEDLLRIATESLHGIRAVKASTGEREMAARFHRQNKTVVRHELKSRFARSLSSPIVETMAIFAMGIIAIIAAKQIIDGRMDFTNFLLAIGSLAIAGASFRPLAGLINEMQASSAPAERLLDVLDEPREVARDQHRMSLPRHTKTLIFRNVSFAYEGADEMALRDVSLTVAHGEKVAIVGPNGSGKTTLLAMVPRLLTPTAGSVHIDGIDIATVNMKSLRRQIGVVTQETVLFRDTVRENIAFGASSDRSLEAVKSAAKQAHAGEFIQHLPQGYDTVLAEQGNSLSGGQRQRLAIARAILRKPEILILDEATSQIDSESEALIGDALHEFCRGRTSLLIAHRLSTVLDADRIVVMNEGAIVDIGTHDELLERCDLYQRLAKHQLVSENSRVV